MGSVTRIRPTVVPDQYDQFANSAAFDPELVAVLAELSRLMSAEGAVLSLHAGRGDAPELLGAYLPPELHADMSALLSHIQLSGFVRDGVADPQWTSCTVRDRPAAVLILPVMRIEGHNRLVVSVIFRRPTQSVRASAGQLFASGQPMAMRYFRLWQLERVRACRVAALEAACDVTDMGILLFTRRGDLDFVNAAANDLLIVGDGLRRYRGSVQASDINDSVKLQVALNHGMAANEAVDGAKPIRRSAPQVRLKRANGKPLIAIVVAAEQRVDLIDARNVSVKSGASHVLSTKHRPFRDGGFTTIALGDSRVCRRLVWRTVSRRCCAQ